MLKNVKLDGNYSLKTLKMHLNHELDDVEYLPSSLQVLWISRNKIINYDFISLSNLKQFYVYVEEGQENVNREDILNLKKNVSFKGDAKW